MPESTLIMGRHGRTWDRVHEDARRRHRCSVGSGSCGLRRQHPGLRGPDRPLAAPRLHPRGGHRRPAARPGRRRVRLGPRRAARRAAARHRVGVPADRCDPARAQVPASAARCPTRSTTTRSSSAGRSATSSSPGSSSAGPTPPRPTRSSSLAEEAARSVPRDAGLDDGFVVHAPDLLAGRRTRAARPGLPAGDRERPAPQVDLSHVTVDTVTVSEAVRGAGGRAARDRADHLSGADRPLPDADRGHRALPGAARAVQGRAR